MPQAKWGINLNSSNEPQDPRISPRNEVPSHPFEFKAHRRSGSTRRWWFDCLGIPVATVTTMTDVQIAIKDQSYAVELRRLLVADGKHRVHVVQRPTLPIRGVVVLDATLLHNLMLPEGHDLRRCVVFSHNETLDVNSIWKAGIRHVIHADYPPPVGRLVVLAAEMRLNAGEPGWENCDESVDLVEWNSDEVAKSMNVLQRSRSKVQIEIDAVLLDGESAGRDSETPEDNADFDGVSMFDATHRLFFRR
jgi:hypothetical protein